MHLQKQKNINIIDTGNLNVELHRDIKNLVKLALDEVTMKILQMAVVDNLYPNQIARKLGKSNSLIVKRLKDLERGGIIEGRFETEGGKAVRKYKLIAEKLILSVDLVNSSVDLQREKGVKYFEEFVSKCPTLFENRQNYLSWERGSMKPEEIALRMELTLPQAEELVKNVQGAIDQVFSIAFQQKLKKWRGDEGDACIDFTEDYVVIPTERLGVTIEGVDAEMIKRLSEGEVLLSHLENGLDTQNIKRQVEDLESRKMVVLEKKSLPKIVFDNVNRITKTHISKPGGDKNLHYMGKAVGKEIFRLVQESSLTLLNETLRGAKVTRKNGRRVIKVDNCTACIGIAQTKACYFIAGFIESILEMEHPGIIVREATCKANGDMTCTFIEEGTTPDKRKSAERVKELLK